MHYPILASSESAAQEEPQTPEGAFEAIQNEHADFFDTVQGTVFNSKYFEQKIIFALAKRRLMARFRR